MKDKEKRRGFPLIIDLTEWDEESGKEFIQALSSKIKLKEGRKLGENHYEADGIDYFISKE